MEKSKIYSQYTFDPFIDNWQNYYKENFLSFNDELEDLKRGLDITSIKNIDSFVNLMLFKLKTPSNKYLIKTNYLYSEEDIQKIKKEKLKDIEINHIYEKFNIDKSFNLEIPSFRYHNGLKLLPQDITKSITNGSVIDGGAYYGDSSLNFSRYNPSNIYAIEPNSVNFNHLQQTIKNNHLDNIIIPINKALGDKEGTINLGFNSYDYPNLGASAVFNHSKKKQEQVTTTTLDKLTEEYNIKNLKLIKLDLEGYEFESLLMAKNTIIKYKPILLIAIYHTLEEFLKIKPWLDGLNLGYKFIFVPLDTKEILKEFYLIAYI